MEIKCKLLNDCSEKDKFQTLNTGIIYKNEPITLCDEVGSPVAHIKNTDELINIIEKGYFKSDVEYSEIENYKFKILSVKDGGKTYYPKQKEEDRGFERCLEF